MNSDMHASDSSASTLDLVESSAQRRAELLTAFETAMAQGADLALDEAFLILSAYLTSGFDVIDYQVCLDDLAAEVASPTVEGIARFLFREPDAFIGNASDYYDPRNSFLDQLLNRRMGIPITLSVLMIEIGRRLGVPLCGVGMPGHFLVGSAVQYGRIPDVFVDPFHGGQILDVEGCRALFRRMAGNSPFDVRFLASIHPIAVVDRALNNLKAIYSSTSDTVALQRTLLLRSRIPGIGRVERDEFLRSMAPFN